VRYLTIVLSAAVLLFACGGDKSDSAADTAPLAEPDGPNADVVQFMRDYHLVFEDVYSGRVRPARLMEIYAPHCTENLRPTALDVFVLATTLNRPAANATKVEQVDVGDVQVEEIPDWPDYLNVTVPGERGMRFMVGGKWVSGEAFEGLIKSKTPLSSEQVTRELLRIDGRLYISDCDFARGLPPR
jgi:hypothetical protein